MCFRKLDVMNLTLFTQVVPDFAAKMCTCDGLMQREWGGGPLGARERRYVAF